MSFWRGFITAILVLEWIALAWLVRAAPVMRAMLADFGDAELPWVFSVVTSTTYGVVCLVGVVGAALLADRLPRTAKTRVLGLASVAVAAGAVVAFTWYGLYSPIFALTGKIR
jgi:hypothetical protein